MLTINHRFVLEFYKEDGTALGQVPAEDVDWEPARECALFDSARQAPGDVAAEDTTTTIEPVPHPSAGAPYIGGFRVAITADGSPLAACEFPSDYFKSCAQRAAAGLVEQGVFQAGEKFRYLVSAYPQMREKAKQEATAIVMKESIVAVPMKVSRLEDYTRASMTIGDGDGADMPVFVPQAVLDEVSELTRAAEAVETGGVLLGHVHRSDATAFLAVTAQVPAKHTHADLNKVVFTADTWTAARSAIALRHQQELLVGWWHSHPGKFFCNAECPPEKRKACALQKNFFSGDDVAFHRTVFPKAFHVALVATNADSGIQFALFGWNRAILEQRKFNVLHCTKPAAVVERSVHETTCKS
ncbi:MAG: Mov34/MPN/PAD-1 family protein [Verrucomicrobia bacterium]|nr:Mov34/MPN/PAD-1 family protein [Verrucomicrobiota bacterium]